MARLMKKILSPFFHDDSLRNLDVKNFVDIFYPIGLSLILAYSIDQFSESELWINLSIFRIIRILTGCLLILYILYDWDDCHHAINLDTKTTSYDRIAWLVAIFWLSLVTVSFLNNPDSCMVSLVLWVLYASITAAFRDNLIQQTNTADYGSYKTSRNYFIGFLIFILLILFSCMIDSIDIRKLFKKKIDTKSFGLYIFFVTCILAILLKNQRKIKLFKITEAKSYRR